MTKRRLSTFLPLTILAVILLAFWQRQYIYDQYQLFGYTPEASIAQLATDSAMTEDARRMYYVNHPLLVPQVSFSRFCSVSDEESAVLGCYKSGQQGIYLLDVANAELAGIKQVTAAHEMLHAAYDRLSSSERKDIDSQLQAYYQSGLQSETVKKMIDGYKKSEPNDLVNEMHSIFGTQIKALPAELEQYYSRYFSDRSKVVAYYEAYEKAFTSRQDQIKQYDLQLNAQKTEIDQLQDKVSSQQTELKTKRSALDRHEANNNAAAYNAGVDDYNAAVNAYNANVTRLQGLIARYNQLIESRNSIAFEERELVKSISSPAATP